jgi:hypothetical protein
LAPIQTGKLQELAKFSARLPEGQAIAVGVALGVGVDEVGVALGVDEVGVVVGVAVEGLGVMVGADVAWLRVNVGRMLGLELSPPHPTTAISKRLSRQQKIQIVGLLPTS